MAKNKPTPLKDEPVMSLDDISTKLDNLATSIGALQKEPSEPAVPKVNIKVKGLHFKTEEEFREKVPRTGRCLYPGVTRKRGTFQ